MREKNGKMWCESRNPFMKMAVTLSMTLSLFYWLTSKNRIVSMHFRTFRKDLKRDPQFPTWLFPFSEIVASAEWEGNLITFSWFKNNFWLDLLRSQQWISGNTSNNGQSLNSLQQVVRELLWRGQHGIESRCTYCPPTPRNKLGIISSHHMLYLRPLNIITSS